MKKKRNIQKRNKTSSKMNAINKFSLENVNEKTLENQDIISFANYIFEQIKLQQEARDKWMEFYLAIFGGVATFATFALTFLDDRLDLCQLERIIGATFILAGIIGFVFYLLFLCQRINYKMHYKVLDEIQRKIVSQYLSRPYNEYYQVNRSPFKKFKKGADFYASIIYNLVIVACFMIGIVFLLISCQIKVKNIIYICSGISIIFEAILRWLYNRFEKVI